MQHNEKCIKTGYKNLDNLAKSIDEPFVFKVPLKKETKVVKPSK